MKNYITKSTKSPKIRTIINEALDILECAGIPFTGKSQRSLERMAVCFLAVANITTDWKQAKGNSNLRSRDVIEFVNKHFEETISPGSYDDIRRKDLALPVLAGIIINTGVGKGSATNDPTRGYALHPDFHQLILAYKTKQWEDRLSVFCQKKPKLDGVLDGKRRIAKIPVTLPNGLLLELSQGQHNVLQKALIEEFLPRFGKGCEVLYIGDTANKSLHLEKEKLQTLKFFELSHGKLPDIVAYNKTNRWLFLIEAVYRSGTMSTERVAVLKQMLKECKAVPIFVTAFLTRTDFKKWIQDVAWETEVWIAENPDHLIHFNGHKFLGPY
jgi:type II restriction enzyme